MGGTGSVEPRTGGGSRFRFAIFPAPATPEDIAAVRLGEAALLDRAPEDILAELRPLVEMGAVSKTECWVDEFEVAHPASPSFANALRMAAMRLDFTTMRQLTETALRK